LTILLQSIADLVEDLFLEASYLVGDLSLGASCLVGVLALVAFLVAFLEVLSLEGAFLVAFQVAYLRALEVLSLEAAFQVAFQVEYLVVLLVVLSLVVVACLSLDKQLEELQCFLFLVVA